ncbi:hypothetical protein NP493_814g01043 [Ridgeia piscesae]|uniref:Uncharacterized protein n=1 Tax=Ridgeia piscesae TaxID=27915 RepID=A0AAD9NL35_RIDPI|nr:hypothetical protein NP493_814g01043 [Ridgeia piscesae]
MLSVDRSAGDGESEEDRDDGRGLDMSMCLVRELSPPINESTLKVENGFLVGSADFTFNAGLTDGLPFRETSWSLIPVSESELVRFVSVSPPQVGLLNADVRPVCCSTPAAIAARGTASTTPDIELAGNNENTPTHNRPVSGLSHSPPLAILYTRPLSVAATQRLSASAEDITPRPSPLTSARTLRELAGRVIASNA